MLGSSAENRTHALITYNCCPVKNKTTTCHNVILHLVLAYKLFWGGL